MSGRFSNDPRLATVAGGWKRCSIDVGWTRIEMVVPIAPDGLLDEAAVLEANRRDDYMPYWASLWPAAARTATALERADWPRSARVLEVGCGLGLVGIAALLRGWDVVMTDYEPRAVAAAAVNAEHNGFRHAQTAVLDWRHPPGETYDVVLACDVLYEIRNHEPMLRFLKCTLTANGCCWIGDPGRTPAAEFPHAAVAAGFDVCIRNERGLTQTAANRGEFQLFELRRRGAFR